ncbi:MAG: DUF3825 domain-containing protein [Clostridia bacterium]|nr:DUF3825 domain-containing protein [Clostridia bacterium]
MENKFGFTNIGFVENIRTYLPELRKITGITTIDKDTLNAKIDHAWANRYNDVLCLNRNLEPTDSNGKDILFILIDTGLSDFITGNTVYGGFAAKFPTDLTEEPGKWVGVTLGTKETIFSIWETHPFAKPTALESHTNISSYTGLAAYISRITDRPYTAAESKNMLDRAFTEAKKNAKLINCRDQISYFCLPEISTESTTYYAYSKKNRDYPDSPTEWFKLYIVTEDELVEILLDTLCFHIGDLLFDDIKEANNFLLNLSNKAMKEKWQWNSNDRSKQSSIVLPILKSYIGLTYHHLQDEDRNIDAEEDKKIKRFDGKAYFNTGLLDRYFRQIFIVGDIDYIFLNIPSPFHDDKIKKEVLHHVRFYSENDPQITRNFPKNMLPKLACYFKNHHDVVFDASLDIHFNDEHIFIDGVARKRIPKYIEAYNKCKDDAEKVKTLACRIARDFESACERAKRLAERNYKLAVPQYWKETGEIQFLLPIYLGEDEEADTPQCALVLSLDHTARNHSYRGETILTLDMAYNNARLLAKPDVFWLNDSE